MSLQQTYNCARYSRLRESHFFGRQCTVISPQKFRSIGTCVKAKSELARRLIGRIRYVVTTVNSVNFWKQTVNWSTLFTTTVNTCMKDTGELKTAHGRMMPPLLHVCNGLARPVDESMLARDIGTTGRTMRQTSGQRDIAKTWVLAIFSRTFPLGHIASGQSPSQTIFLPT